MPTVQYDDTASFTFAFVLLGFVTIPATIFAIKRACSKALKIPAKSAGSKRGRGIVENWGTGRRQGTGRNLCWVLFSVTCLALMWAAFIWLGTAMAAGDDYFDPFDILGVPTNANRKTIRKSYRKLSLANHPDKGGDAAAFMKIATAYKALFDETGRKNWEKYGHPDGPQSMAMKMAIPSFLTSDANKATVMGLYVALLLVVIPSLFFAARSWCKRLGAASARKSAFANILVKQLVADCYIPDPRQKALAPQKLMEPNVEGLVHTLAVVMATQVIGTSRWEVEAVSQCQNLYQSFKEKVHPPVGETTEANDRYRAASALLLLHLDRSNQPKAGVSSKKMGLAQLSADPAFEATGKLYDKILCNMRVLLEVLLEVCLASRQYSLAKCAVDAGQQITQGLGTNSEACGATYSKDLLGLQRRLAAAAGDAPPPIVASADLQVRAFTADEDSVCCGDVVTVEIRLRRGATEVAVAARSLLRDDPATATTTTSENGSDPKAERWVALGRDLSEATCSKRRLLLCGPLVPAATAAADTMYVLNAKARAPKKAQKWRLEVAVQSFTHVLPLCIQVVEVDVQELPQQTGDDEDASSGEDERDLTEPTLVVLQNKGFSSQIG